MKITDMNIERHLEIESEYNTTKPLDEIGEDIKQALKKYSVVMGILNIKIHHNQHAGRGYLTVSGFEFDYLPWHLWDKWELKANCLAYR